MPKIDIGPTDGPPGPPVPVAWMTLSESEAEQLLASLHEWNSERDGGVDVAGWHIHIADADGNELTVAIGDA